MIFRRTTRQRFRQNIFSRRMKATQILKYTANRDIRLLLFDGIYALQVEVQNWGQKMLENGLFLLSNWLVFLGQFSHLAVQTVRGTFGQSANDAVVPIRYHYWLQSDSNVKNVVRGFERFFKAAVSPKWDGRFVIRFAESSTFTFEGLKRAIGPEMRVRRQFASEKCPFSSIFWPLSCTSTTLHNILLGIFSFYVRQHTHTHTPA